MSIICIFIYLLVAETYCTCYYENDQTLTCAPKITKPPAKTCFQHISSVHVIIPPALVSIHIMSAFLLLTIPCIVALLP